MISIAAYLKELFCQALVAALGDDGRGVDPLIRPAGEAKFGDYQSNVAMSLAKKVGAKPRDLAVKILEHLPDEAKTICEPFEIAGAGFINVRLSAGWMARQLGAIPDAKPQAAMGTDAKPQAGERLGIELGGAPQTVVVDYSGPNIAKQMHVGHLRSTIIGDTIARVIAFEGHRVIRQNHIGDWGTQFGMLCAHLKEKMPAALERPEDVHLADLEAFYREASARDKADAAFHERARAEVVALHKKDDSTLRAWRYIVDESRRHYLPVYRRLGVQLTQADERGESFYADRLAEVVAWFERAKEIPAPAGLFADGAVLHVEESEGVLCIFFAKASGEPIFKNPEGKPFPLIIRKTDGAFLYATTDLAALRYRLSELGADRVIYVTDARQAQHFEMVFTAVRAAGWTVTRGGVAGSREGIPAEDGCEKGFSPQQTSPPVGLASSQSFGPARCRSHTGFSHEQQTGFPHPQTEVQLDHVPFGTILGEDRKPLKTRSGENVKLAELLDEAVRRAEGMIRANEADADKRRGFSEAEIRDVAEAVGIGAVKYADLSQNRQSDYVFSWDRMLAMEGNTAPYLMYVYARIRSIYRKGEAEKGGEWRVESGDRGQETGDRRQETGDRRQETGDRRQEAGGAIALVEPAERMLGRQILRFAEMIDAVAAGLRINLLTDYLYELAGLFMKFYEQCPVLRAETDEIKSSRLRLCDLTARTLRLGLDLLGIRVVERM